MIARTLLALVAVSAGCAGRTPPTRYYDLAPPATVAEPSGPLLVLEQLTTDEAYDDERIVYRTGRFRLDYYDYHRWSAPPGVMVGTYLERALEQSGQFRGVVREVTRDAKVVLGGRVVAIEEVDVSKQAWAGHIVVELRLVDTESGDGLWSQQFEESEPLTRQSPDGLAEAISAAMARIVERAAPVIAAELADHVAATPAH